jgi:hypothetical protein
MVSTLLAIGVLIVALAIAAGVFFGIGVLWSAARVLPQKYRMRWPWLIWLLLWPIPIWVVDQVLPLITVIPLARSYRRFFREYGLRADGWSLALAVGYWLLSFFDLLLLTEPLKWTPRPWSPAFHRYFTDIIWATNWGRIAGWILLVLLAWRMWWLRRAVLRAYRAQEASESISAAIPASLRTQLAFGRRIGAGTLLVSVVMLSMDQWWVYAWRIIPIGRQTTWMAAPVAKNGEINYLTALNQREAKGVTPGNNALPLLIRAAGPACFEIQYGDGKWMMRKLSMVPFTKRSQSLITLTTWLKKHPLQLPKPHKPQPKWVIENRFENRITQRPWTATRYPSMAAWIRANQRSLRLFARAMDRPRYYVPLHSNDGSLIATYRPDMPMVESLRTIACADAMYMLGSDHTAGAVRMDQNVDHLARLFLQSPGVIAYLQAISFYSSVFTLDQALANSGRLSNRELRKLSAQLQKRTHLPPLEKAINYYRCEMLDVFAKIHRDGLASARDGDRPSMFAQLQQVLLPVDYAGVMRQTNKLFDAEITASTIHYFPKQFARLMLADQKFRAFSGFERVGLTGGLKALRVRIFGGTIPNLLLRSLFSPLDLGVSMSNPHAAEMDSLREDAAMRRWLTIISIALARYRQQYGTYPAELPLLAPHYIKSIPHNGFTGKPIHYATDKTRRGFMLYCTRPATTFFESSANFGPNHTTYPARRISVRGGDWPRQHK